MTARPVMPSEEDVERALVDHYLSSEGPGGAGPVTFIDATGDTLGEALDAPDADTATAWLAHACGGPVRVTRVLKQGLTKTKADSTEVPGHFRFLILTCAVVARAHEAERQSFEHNLRQLLSSDMAFNERQALSGLWRDLEDWCGRRHAAGAAIRRLVLPSADRMRGGQVHIGITNAMAFPNWQSVRKLRGDMAVRPALRTAAAGTESTALEICPRVVAENGYGPEMTTASRSFQAAYFRGDALLQLHRFWTVVRHAAAVPVHRRDAGPALQVRLELLVGATGDDLQVRVDVSGQGGSTLLPFDETPTSAFARIMALDGRSGETWKRMVRGGVVAFEEERFQIWTGTAAVPNGEVQYRHLVLAGIADRLPEEWRSRLRPLAGECEWLHLEPVIGSDAARLHEALGMEMAPGRPVRLVDGIRTAGGWLGRPAFLPAVQRRGTGRIDIRPTDGGIGVKAIEEGSNRIHLHAGAAVEGLYRLQLTETWPDGETLAVEQAARFVADAIPHARLRLPPATMRPCEAECVVSARSALDPTAWPDSSCEEEVAWQAFDDALEAIYARGRLGWKEKQLVELVRKSCPGPSPWDVLRGLQEAGWLERRISGRWRAFEWFLLPPAVVPLADGLSALEGSAPSAVRKRFAAVAEGLGAETSCRPGIGPCSVPSSMARGIDPEVLASRLGWQMALPPLGVRLHAPACWPRLRPSLAGRVPFRFWSWKAAAFRESAEAERRVPLTCHRRLEGDLHDVYEVGCHDAAFLTSSRAVAIVEAYRRARVPLFRCVEDRWVRLGADGHFPLPLARNLHRTAQRAAGPAHVDGRWTYAYALEGSRPAVRVLGSSLFAGGPGAGSAGRPDRSPRSVGLARHRADGWTRVVGSRRGMAGPR